MPFRRSQGYRTDLTAQVLQWRARCGVVFPRRGAPRAADTWTYGLLDLQAGAVKLGSSGANPRLRLADLQTGNPHPLNVLAYTPGFHVTERAAHNALAGEQMKGEWFTVNRRILAYLSTFWWLDVRLYGYVLGRLPPNDPEPAKAPSLAVELTNRTNQSTHTTAAHYHCPRGCVWPQPFVLRHRDGEDVDADADGRTVCGRCFYVLGVVTEMQLCLKQVCLRRVEEARPDRPPWVVREVVLG